MTEPSRPVRVLFLADSHLGFDLPTMPRVARRRRGKDFQVNHERALAAAAEKNVDLVVHGGDLFHRSRVSPSLVFQAFRPLVGLSSSGLPVFVVPGNHERSRIPHTRFAAHPNLHIFHRPGTVVVEVRGLRVAVSGFPYQRSGIRERFSAVLEETGWRGERADLRLLCMHHCVEGATVGPGDYTFRDAADVVRCSDLPSEFAAVLSGHIHRPQTLWQDLDGRSLPAPVLYPGSVERTAFAEMGEEKGFMLLEVRPGARGGTLACHEFVPLPARPMLVRSIHPPGGATREWCRHHLEANLIATLAEVPEDAVLRVRVHGRVPPEVRAVLSARHLRGISPPEMNMDVILVEDRRSRRSRGPRERGRSARKPGDIDLQLSLAVTPSSSEPLPDRQVEAVPIALGSPVGEHDGADERVSPDENAAAFEQVPPRDVLVRKVGSSRLEARSGVDIHLDPHQLEAKQPTVSDDSRQGDLLAEEFPVAETGEAEKPTHEERAEEALHRIQVVAVLDRGNDGVFTEAPGVGGRAPEALELRFGAEGFG